MCANEKELMWEVTDVLISLIMLIISQCLHVSKHYIVENITLNTYHLYLSKINKNEKEFKKKKS